MKASGATGPPDWKWERFANGVDGPWQPFGQSAGCQLTTRTRSGFLLGNPQPPLLAPPARHFASQLGAAELGGVLALLGTYYINMCWECGTMLGSPNTGPGALASWVGGAGDDRIAVPTTGDVEQARSTWSTDCSSESSDESGSCLSGDLMPVVLQRPGLDQRP